MLDAVQREASAALDVALADLDLPRLSEYGLGVARQGAELTLRFADGWSHGNEVIFDWDPTVVLARVAEVAQEYAMERFSVVVPVCDQHNAGLHVEVADARPVWYCSIGSHMRAAVGELITRLGR